MRNCVIGKPCGNSCIAQDRMCCKEPSVASAETFPICSCGKPCGKSCIAHDRTCYADSVECMDVMVPVGNGGSVPNRVPMLYGAQRVSPMPQPPPTPQPSPMPQPFPTPCAAQQAGGVPQYVVANNSDVSVLGMGSVN